MQQESKKVLSGTWLQTYLVGRVQSPAHFHFSWAKSKCKQILITHRDWQMVSIAATTACHPTASRGTIIHRETRADGTSRDEEVHMRGWVRRHAVSLREPCLDTDGATSR